MITPMTAARENFELDFASFLRDPLAFPRQLEDWPELGRLDMRPFLQKPLTQR
jgi:hypothetical protein